MPHTSKEPFAVLLNSFWGKLFLVGLSGLPSRALVTVLFLFKGAAKPGVLLTLELI